MVFKKGYKPTKEHLKNLSIGHIGLPGNKGWKHTETTIVHMKEMRKCQAPPMLGKHHSLITKKSLSENRKGTKWHHTKESKRNLRFSTLEYLKNTSNFNGPRTGKHEKEILDKLQQIISFSIKRNFFIDGYFLDGYCQELNLAIEVDESSHFNYDGSLKEKDSERQNNIMHLLNCKFLRIKEKDYLNNGVNVFNNVNN